jgi:hypothetical protein
MFGGALKPEDLADYKTIYTGLRESRIQLSAIAVMDWSA